MLESQLLPGYAKHAGCSFTVTRGTQARIVSDVAEASVVSAVSGETALPGESAVRQRVLTGGQTIRNLMACSTDGTDRSAILYVGELLFSSAITITGQNVINGSGFTTLPTGTSPLAPGDAVMMFNPNTFANEGVIGIATTVTATAITVNGTPWTNDASSTSTRIFRVQQILRQAIPLNSGNTDSVSPALLLGGSRDPATYALNPERRLGAREALIVAMVSAVSALPARIDVFCERELV